MLGGEFANHHADQSDDAQRRQKANLVLSEPVFFLPLVEHHLQRAKAKREKSDAPHVDAVACA